MDTFLLSFILLNLIIPFNITVFALTTLWGICSLRIDLPSEEEKETDIKEVVASGISIDWYRSATSRIKTVKSVGITLGSVLWMSLLIFALHSTPYDIIIDTLNDAWTHIIGSSAEHDSIFTIIVMGGHLIIFWSMSIIFMILDLTRPVFMIPWKIQEEGLNVRKYIQCTLLVICNQGISTILVWGMSHYLIDGDAWSETLPEATEIILQLLACACASEVWFYFGHRLCHLSNFIYNHVHWLHHTITAPSAITAIYAHPLEHIFINFPTTAIGPLLMNCHVIVFFMWTVLATFDTCSGHSGWHFPFMSSPEFHDFHHSFGTENFGALNFFDKYFQTSKTFLTTCNYIVDKVYRTAMYPADKRIF